MALSSMGDVSATLPVAEASLSSYGDDDGAGEAVYKTKNNNTKNKQKHGISTWK
jgi:hypothetical protein